MRLLRDPGLIGLCGLSLVVAFYLLRGGIDLTPIADAANGGPSLFADADGDGMSDSLELYLNSASTAVQLTANPYNADSDGDGQPDGFEYCLSGGKDVFSPATQWAVVPTMNLTSHQSGDNLQIGIQVIPGDVGLIQSFRFYMAYPGKSGFEMQDMTAFFAKSIESVGFASYGQHLMTVYQMKLPLSLVRTTGSLAVGVVGVVAGVKVGDSATFAMHGGKCFKWEYESSTGFSGGSNLVSGEGEPQEANVPAGWIADEVCGSIEVREPTAIPGLLKSVVQAIGCHSGVWACPAGVCSKTASAGADKPVIDVFALTLPGGGG